MKESTKRALRTLKDALIAAIVVVPILATAFPEGTPAAAYAATAVAALAVVSKAMNALEDAGLIPAWLKDTPRE